VAGDGGAHEVNPGGLGGHLPLFSILKTSVTVLAENDLQSSRGKYLIWN
jgi:hypothetical protein